jgi:hypothetical protein
VRSYPLSYLENCFDNHTFAGRGSVADTQKNFPLEQVFSKLGS